ncbi:MAG: hypothetical protein LBK77_03825 [Spirochaetaceae bacterium]|jgi:ribosomal protein S27E|nr:hypothetical protein [Spirochaetaceae bacterium]
MIKAKTAKHTGRLCSVWCPGCGRVTQKISFNLLREAGTVKVTCPVCLNATTITYDGKTAELTWLPPMPR